MINFIQNNPLVVVMIGVILAIVIVLLLVKVSSPSQKKSSESEKPSNEAEQKVVPPEELIDDGEKNKEQKDENTKDKNVTEKEEKKSKKKSKEKPKKEIEQVFKPKKTEEQIEETESKVDERVKEEERELLEKMEFVKTSKVVSKLAKREKIEKVPESEFTPDELIQIYSMIAEGESKQNGKNRRREYFDKSIRLSDFSKSGDYADMFVSHISESQKEHLNYKKHLHINEDFVERLYERTTKTLEHSGISQSDDTVSIDDFDLFSLDSSKSQNSEIDPEHFNEETIFPELYEDEETKDINAADFAPKNVLVVDTLMHRKNNFKRK